jgi:predicted CopG family antitoxin
VTDENREKLKSRGRAGDSFNDVISQLLKQTAIRSNEKT